MTNRSTTQLGNVGEDSEAQSDANSFAYGSTILIVDDDEAGLERLALLCMLSKRGEALQVLTATTLTEATSILASNVVQAMLLDKQLDKGPACEDGIDAIPRFLQLQPHLQIVIITASNDTQDAARAIGLGALWYFPKQTPDQMILAQIDKAIDIGEMALQRSQVERQNTPAKIDLVGRSTTIKQLKQRVLAVAETSRPILLLGETGTGKTTIARLIHEHRNNIAKNQYGKFYSVNMGAISADLAERELFGNEKGAFTDAKELRPGLFELSNNGTLFLDEIGEAPLDLQVKLLKVIEEGTFMRLGGSQVRQTKLKIICATNRNLESLVAAGEFREDLYFRISTFALTIPPLSERREDIPDIIAATLPKCCAENRVFICFDDLPKDFVDYLTNTPLRGNVREIEQIMSRLLVYAPKDRRGRPDLRNWREISGLTVKAPVLSSNQNSALTMNDFRLRPMQVVGEGFPGLDAFVQMVSDKVMLDAMSHSKKLKDISRALSISMTRGSIARRRVLHSENAPPHNAGVLPAAGKDEVLS